jgi:multidrug efflux system outer membrane protein
MIGTQVKTDYQRADRAPDGGPARGAFAMAAAALAAGALLAGCASVAPDRHALRQRDITHVELAADIKLAREGWPEAQWWSAYGDPQLTALIQQALSTGPSLEVAAAHIGSAESGVQRSAADLGADVSAYATANRQRYSGTGLFPAPIGGAYFSEQTLRLDARYNFDWWGRNRAQIAAAVGEVNAGRAAYAQAEQVLAAAIAQGYFRLQGGWARQANLDLMIAAQWQLVQDQARRVNRGLATADELRAAESEASLLNKQRAQVAAEVRREREGLRALVGSDNAQQVSATDQLLASLKPQALASARDGHASLPAHLGMELLARRPDLQAARWRVEASLSKIEAAKAAFYPDINLAGSVGLDTIKLENLLQGASRTLFIGPSVTLPLFDSKRLNAQMDSARSERNELIADYNQAVVQAVRDVAQDGVVLQGLEQQLAQQDAANTLAAAQLHSAQARRDHGLGDQASVLNAQLALLQQQDAALSLRQLQLLAEVALVNSLGGGYNGTPSAPARQASQ